MIENLFLFSNNILNAMLIAVIGALAAYIIGAIIIRLFQKIMGKTFSIFVATLARLAISIWTLKIILDLSGAAGIVVILVTVITGAFAIGSERFASDIIAGIKLFTSRPYEVGHHVVLDGHEVASKQWNSPRRPLKTYLVIMLSSATPTWWMEPSSINLLCPGN